MKPITTKLIATCAALCLSATLASAQVDTKQTTIVTFSAPVALPGITLPAGSYTFQLADSQVNRNIVQVFNKDRSQILATILAIPAQRTTPADDTVITFKETPANVAPAIQYWYYPGETRGQEFAYPKTQAQQIANANHNSVLSVDTDDTSADAIKNGKISRVEPEANANASAAQGAQSSSQSNAKANSAMTPQSSAQSAQSQPEPSAQATPQPTAAPTQPSTPSASAERTPAPMAQSTTPTSSPSAATSPSTTGGAVGTSGTRPAKLPKTASSLPLVGFVGLLALTTAFGIRVLRRVEI